MNQKAIKNQKYYNCKNEKIFLELEIKAGEDNSCLKCF